MVGDGNGSRTGPLWMAHAIVICLLAHGVTGVARGYTSTSAVLDAGALVAPSEGEHSPPFSIRCFKVHHLVRFPSVGVFQFGHLRCPAGHPTAHFAPHHAPHLADKLSSSALTLGCWLAAFGQSHVTFDSVCAAQHRKGPTPDYLPTGFWLQVFPVNTPLSLRRTLNWAMLRCMGMPDHWPKCWSPTPGSTPATQLRGLMRPIPKQ